MAEVDRTEDVVMLEFDTSPDPNDDLKRSQAIEIVQKQFADGLAELCDPYFLVE